jgi:hypothetical protein
MEFKDLPGQPIRHRQAVEATVLLACASCRAPGVYKDHESIRAGWPGCYVASDDPRLGQSVGPICPHCGETRPDGKSLGIIWHNGG